MTQAQFSLIAVGLYLLLLGYVVYRGSRRESASDYVIGSRKVGVWALTASQISQVTKEELRQQYESLNPAELKRQIDIRQKELQATYDRIATRRKEVYLKLKPKISVSKLIIQPKDVRCHS